MVWLPCRPRDHVTKYLFPVRWPVSANMSDQLAVSRPWCTTPYRARINRLRCAWRIMPQYTQPNTSPMCVAHFLIYRIICLLHVVDKTELLIVEWNDTQCVEHIFDITREPRGMWNLKLKVIYLCLNSGSESYYAMLFVFHCVDPAALPRVRFYSIRPPRSV